jgi:hypothetical protein
MLDEGPPGPLAVVKFVVEAKGSEPKEYRITRVRLTCGRAAEVRVEYSREVSALDQPASIAVTTRADAFVLAPPRSKPVLGYNDVQIEDRFARVPVAFFEDAATGDAIEITQAPNGSMPDKTSRPVRLSLDGLSDAIGILAKRCRR